MKCTVSTMDVRHNLGEILNRISLRNDQYIVERKGKPLAVMVPVEKAKAMEEAARIGILDILKKRDPKISAKEAMEIADLAKHKSRS